MRLVCFAVAVAACGNPHDAAWIPQRLVFERWSQPQPTGHDIFLAARGDIVVMAHRVSLDAGATWQPLDPRLGEPTRVAINDRTIALYASGLVRWDLTTGAVTQVAGTPAYATDRNWRIEPTSGHFIVFDQIENAIAVERDGGWTLGTLPQPATTETRPYIRDIESNGSVLLAASVWGVHRSLDAGATWQLVTSSVAGAGRDLLVLADHRFALVGGTTTYVFDSAGQAAGTLASLVVSDNVATVCDDGSIIAANKVTRDLGATWQTLIFGGDLKMDVPRTGCGSGRYWFLVISEAWGYRLVRYDSLTAPGIVAGNWDAQGDQAWNPSGPPIVRTQDGTFLVAGLALRPTDPTWVLQEMPARAWASGPTLFGVADDRFYTSYDGGATWSATAATGLAADEPEAFALADSALHVSQFTGNSEGDVDTWHSLVWRSADSGATWTVAYDATATRVRGTDEVAGEVHRFVGVTAEGVWIATDAVSHDRGATWTKTEVDGDRGLAHLMPNGNLVTGNANEQLWRIYADGGLGDLLATYTIEVDGKTIAASELRNVAFDELGYAYTARGTPNVQIWRSNHPVE